MRGTTGLILGIIALVAIVAVAAPFALDSVANESTAGWSTAQVNALAYVGLGVVLAAVIAVVVTLGMVGRHR